MLNKQNMANSFILIDIISEEIFAEIESRLKSNNPYDIPPLLLRLGITNNEDYNVILDKLISKSGLDPLNDQKNDNIFIFLSLGLKISITSDQIILRLIRRVSMNSRMTPAKRISILLDNGINYFRRGDYRPSLFINIKDLQSNEDKEILNYILTTDIKNIHPWIIMDVCGDSIEACTNHVFMLFDKWLEAEYDVAVLGGVYHDKDSLIITALNSKNEDFLNYILSKNMSFKEMPVDTLRKTFEYRYYDIARKFLEGGCTDNHLDFYNISVQKLLSTKDDGLIEYVRNVEFDKERHLFNPKPYPTIKQVYEHFYEKKSQKVSLSFARFLQSIANRSIFPEIEEVNYYQNNL